MATRELRYALPLSCIDVEGTITRTTDVLGATTTTPEAVATLGVRAGRRDRVLRIESGLLRDTSVTFELTEDGRLRSADADSTGQLGRVLLGVAGAAAAVAGTAIGGPAGALRAVRGFVRLETFDDDAAPDVEPQRPGGDDPVAARYRAAHPDVAGLRDRYVQLLGQTVSQIAAVSAKLLDPETEASRRWRLRSELHALEDQLPLLRAQLEPLDEHFRAWKAARTTTHVERHARSFSLDLLRGANVRIQGGSVELSASAHPDVVSTWDDLGLAFTMDPVGTPSDVPEVDPNDVVVRIPRRVVISTWERVGSRAVLRERRPHLVVDSACETEVLALRKSLWARRSIRLGFGELGGLTSYGHSDSSAAAAAADALGGMPEKVAGGLEQAGKIRTQLGSLRGAALADEVTRAEQLKRLKEAEIASAGFAATARDAAELERLKQQVALAEQRARLAPAAAPDEHAVALAALRRQLDLLTAQLSVAATTRWLQEEQALVAARDGNRP